MSIIWQLLAAYVLIGCALAIPGYLSERHIGWMGFVMIVLVWPVIAVMVLSSVWSMALRSPPPNRP